MKNIAKDIFGNELHEGDTVGAVYHKEAYLTLTVCGKIESISDRMVQIKTTEGDQFGVQNKEEKVVKAVKINDYLPSQNEGPKDAIGQLIEIGKRVAVMRKVELGTTCKGFFDGGKITKITGSYVFFENAGPNGETRKGFDKVVIIN